MIGSVSRISSVLFSFEKVLWRFPHLAQLVLMERGYGYVRSPMGDMWEGCAIGLGLVDARHELHLICRLS